MSLLSFWSAGYWIFLGDDFRKCSCIQHLLVRQWIQVRVSLGASLHFSAVLGSTVDTTLRQSTVSSYSAQRLDRQWIHICVSSQSSFVFQCNAWFDSGYILPLSSSFSQMHGYCWYAGCDAFVLCSLRRRQARAVSTGAVAACFACWAEGCFFLKVLHIRCRTGGRVHRDTAPIISCTWERASPWSSAPQPPAVFLESAPVCACAFHENSSGRCKLNATAPPLRGGGGSDGCEVPGGTSSSASPWLWQLQHTTVRSRTPPCGERTPAPEPGRVRCSRRTKRHGDTSPADATRSPVGARATACGLSPVVQGCGGRAFAGRGAGGCLARSPPRRALRLLPLGPETGLQRLDCEEGERGATDSLTCRPRQRGQGECREAVPCGAPHGTVAPPRGAGRVPGGGSFCPRWAWSSREPPPLSAPPPQASRAVCCGGRPSSGPWPQSPSPEAAIPATAGTRTVARRAFSHHLASCWCSDVLREMALMVVVVVCVGVRSFVLFCFVLFCFVLFCFVLFCFVLFCFVLFCFVLFCFVLFCFVLFCFVLFCFVLFCFVLFCFVLFCFVLFCFVLFCFVCVFVCLCVCVFVCLCVCVFVCLCVCVFVCLCVGVWCVVCGVWWF